VLGDSPAATEAEARAAEAAATAEGAASEADAARGDGWLGGAGGGGCGPGGGSGGRGGSGGGDRGRGGGGGAGSGRLGEGGGGGDGGGAGCGISGGGESGGGRAGCGGTAGGGNRGGGFVGGGNHGGGEAGGEHSTFRLSSPADDEAAAVADAAVRALCCWALRSIHQPGHSHCTWTWLIASRSPSDHSLAARHCTASDGRHIAKLASARRKHRSVGCSQQCNARQPENCGAHADESGWVAFMP
jgi:hypothetical protein